MSVNEDPVMVISCLFMTLQHYFCPIVLHIEVHMSTCAFFWEEQAVCCYDSILAVTFSPVCFWQKGKSRKRFGWTVRLSRPHVPSLSHHQHRKAVSTSLGTFLEGDPLLKEFFSLSFQTGSIMLDGSRCW